MPKFLYTVIVFAFLFWSLLVRMLVSVPPNTPLIIGGALILAFLALLTTFSLPLYFIFTKKAPDFMNLRFLYRKAAKWSALLSFFVVGNLALRAFDLSNYINVTLLLILCVMIGLHLGKSR